MRLVRLVPLAPLHQPHNLAGIRALAAQHPGLPQVACFDTAFRATQDELAQLYALPHRFAEAGGPRLTTAGSRVAAWVVPTDEEAMIARHTLALLGAPR